MEAVGVHAHPSLKLGLRPATPGRPRLRLVNYLLPSYPPSVDYSAGVEFGLYQNDRFGVCGPTAVANYRRLISAKLGGAMKAPTQDDVFDLYRRSGNPRFNPATGDDDNGVNMQEMLTELAKNGIGGVKCVAFASVDPSNTQEMRAADAIFGGLLHGVMLQQAQQAQTNVGTWDYSPSRSLGGHAVLSCAYNPQTVGVITWAQRVKMTEAFMHRQNQEAWIVIWPEHLTDDNLLNSMDLVELAKDYEDLTGRKFPAVVPPKPPAPTPVPVPPPPQPTPGRSTLVIAGDNLQVSLNGKVITQ